MKAIFNNHDLKRSRFIIYFWSKYRNKSRKREDYESNKFNKMQSRNNANIINK